MPKDITTHERIPPERSIRLTLAGHTVGYITAEEWLEAGAPEAVEFHAEPTDAAVSFVEENRPEPETDPDPEESPGGE